MDIKDCRRIMIVGCSGSGKSTVAVQLGEKLNLPVIHLDCYFWQPDWEELPRENWLNIHSDLIEEESWIIDGNFSNCMYERAKRADGIIFLDINRLVCFKNLLKRRFKYARKPRPGMAPDCPEELSLRQISQLTSFKKHSSHRIHRILRHAEEKYTVTLYSRREIKKWLDSIE